MGQEIWYITTPIYYPSDNLHIGHAYTTVAADAFARYHRLLGEDVLFVTGTDEHGQKIQKQAEIHGSTPQAFVDPIVAFIQDPLWRRLGISYDDFIRTTEGRHKKVVQSVFSRLLEQGDIYKGTYEGWYCLPDESFWTESKLENGKCPDCGRPVQRVSQESYFFRLSRYQDRIEQYLLDHPEFVQPVSRRNEMLGFIGMGLEDLSISRKGMSWGVAVPNDPDHVIYVWFDALINYLTAAGYEQDPERFAKTWPANVHLVGKEIVRFHSVIWPIMLMALGLPLPKRVFGHGWLLIGDRKIGKSLGNAVDPLALIDRYGVDAVRYYLLREVPFGADGSYTEDALVLRINVDLANDLGNLLSRTTAMIERFAQGRIPRFDPAVDDQVLAKEIAATHDKVQKTMNQLEISGAMAAIWQLVNVANKYIETSQPWALARDDSQRSRLNNVLYTLAETLRVISVLLSPFLLDTPTKIRAQLGLHEPVGQLKEAVFGGLEPGTPIERGTPLFPRLVVEDPPESTPSPSAEPGDKTPEPAQGPSSISLEEFQKIDLRVGTVRQAEIVAGADRLLKLTVFDGERERVIVSGIRSSYQPEQMVGQQVVLVANLKPAKLRGIISEGMLLAASTETGVRLIAPLGTVKEGVRVK